MISVIFAQVVVEHSPMKQAFLALKITLFKGLLQKVLNAQEPLCLDLLKRDINIAVVLLQLFFSPLLKFIIN